MSLGIIPGLAAAATEPHSCEASHDDARTPACRTRWLPCRIRRLQRLEFAIDFFEQRIVLRSLLSPTGDSENYLVGPSERRRSHNPWGRSQLLSGGTSVSLGGLPECVPLFKKRLQLF